MFWKKDREEVEDLKKDNARANRDREAARLNFVRSLQQIRKHLDIPIDRTLADLGGDLAGKRRNS